MQVVELKQALDSRRRCSNGSSTLGTPSTLPTRMVRRAAGRWTSGVSQTVDVGTLEPSPPGHGEVSRVPPGPDRHRRPRGVVPRRAGRVYSVELSSLEDAAARTNSDSDHTAVMYHRPTTERASQTAGSRRDMKSPALVHAAASKEVNEREP